MSENKTKINKYKFTKTNFESIVIASFHTATAENFVTVILYYFFETLLTINVYCDRSWQLNGIWDVWRFADEKFTMTFPVYSINPQHVGHSVIVHFFPVSAVDIVPEHVPSYLRQRISCETKKSKSWIQIGSINHRKKKQSLEYNLKV